MDESVFNDIVNTNETVSALADLPIPETMI